MKMIKSKGPKMLPCGTPQKIGDLEENDFYTINTI